MSSKDRVDSAMNRESLLELHPGVDGAATYRKRIQTVDVAFPDKAGVVQTLEGPICHQAGDAVVTGTRGEQWPIAMETFLKKYEPVLANTAGQPGKYLSRPNKVIAVQLTSPYEITLPGNQGVLRGDAGAWLVQYGLADQAIVAPDVFAETYEPVPN
jgi:hypothetical protein